jgi:anti-sigma factor RsiW
VKAVAHLSIELAESYALKEVSESERQRVEKHVASCPKCADVLAEQLVWVAQMRSPFKRKVEKMIEEERKKRKAKK